MDPLLTAALRSVIDPELGIDIVSLGLVYAAERVGDRAVVKLTMTTPTCPLGESIANDARAALEAVPGVNLAEIDLVFEPRWTPERLSPEARARLGYPDVSPQPRSIPMNRVDVRTIVPRERHPLIFRTFDALKPGEAFELVNDHDPKPLYYQLEAERPGQLAWEYLEQGPQVWRVQVGRAKG